MGKSGCTRLMSALRMSRRGSSSSSTVTDKAEDVEEKDDEDDEGPSRDMYGGAESGDGFMRGATSCVLRDAMEKNFLPGSVVRHGDSDAHLSVSEPVDVFFAHCTGCSGLVQDEQARHPSGLSRRHWAAAASEEEAGEADAATGTVTLTASAAGRVRR